MSYIMFIDYFFSVIHWLLVLQEVQAKKPRIEGKTLDIGSSEQSSTNPKKKKRKKHMEKENEIQGSESKQVKKKKKAKQNPEMARVEA